MRRDRAAGAPAHSPWVSGAVGGTAASAAVGKCWLAGFLGCAVRGTAFAPVTEGNVFNGFNDPNQGMIRNKFVYFSILFQL